jgi:uncharacterized RDD family membrane protein YckC
MRFALLLALLYATSAVAQDAQGGAPDPAAVTAGAEVKATLTAPEGRLLLGDPLDLVLTFEHGPGVDLRLPGKPFVGKAFRVTGTRREGPPAPDGAGPTKYVLTVVPMRVGTQKIPAIEIPYLAGDTAATVSTEPLRLRIAGRLATEIAPELRPASGPTVIRERNWPLIWTLGVLGVALLAAALTLIAVRVVGPRLRALAPKEPPRPAHEIAYERLAALRRADYPTLGEFKAFYLELSEIVREYFGNRYAIQALGDTTTELIESLRAVDTPGLSVDEVERFCWEADLVKFAKMTPQQDDMDEAMVLARLFVDRTREEARERREEVAEAASPKLEPASALRRALALLIDVTAVAIVATLLLAVRQSTGQTWLAWAAVGLGAAWLLGRDLPARGSLGKRVTGLVLQSANADPQGRIGVGRRLVRNATLVVPIAGHVAELIWLAFDPEGRRIGDRWSRTRVVDARPDMDRATAIGAAAGCVALLAVMGYVMAVHLAGS